MYGEIDDDFERSPIYIRPVEYPMTDLIVRSYTEVLMTSGRRMLNAFSRGLDH